MANSAESKTLSRATVEWKNKNYVTKQRVSAILCKSALIRKLLLGYLTWDWDVWGLGIGATPVRSHTCVTQFISDAHVHRPCHG